MDFVQEQWNSGKIVIIDETKNRQSVRKRLFRLYWSSLLFFLSQFVFHQTFVDAHELAVASVIFLYFALMIVDVACRRSLVFVKMPAFIQFHIDTTDSSTQFRSKWAREWSGRKKKIQNPFRATDESSFLCVVCRSSVASYMKNEKKRENWIIHLYSFMYLVHVSQV